jgi:hypothetical protein
MSRPEGGLLKRLLSSLHQGPEHVFQRAGCYTLRGLRFLLIAGAGDRAAQRFLEFFTVNIRNRNTREPMCAPPQCFWKTFTRLCR